MLKLIKRRTMRTYGVDTYIDLCLFYFDINSKMCSSSRPGRFVLEERTFRYPLHQRLGGLQWRSERYGKMKILDPTRARTRTPQSTSIYFIALMK
jgi:hypothetical protein